MKNHYKSLALVLCMLLFSLYSMAQQLVQGIVRDNQGQTIPGVSVKIKGTTMGVMSDNNGRFSINANSGQTIVVSAIGYQSREFNVGNSKVLNVSLVATSSDLNEVVVVGYGTQKKAHLSGAVQQIGGQTLEDRPINNINTGMQGVMANLNIFPASGRATDAPGINIRGYTSLNGGSAFILVDNVPVSSGELALLNPADIESVTILKDAASAAIYGARASYGVMLVTTKKAKSDKVLVSFDANTAIRTIGKMPKLVTDPLTVMQMKADAARPLYNLYPQAERDYAEKLAADPSLPNTIVNPTNPDAWSYYGSTNWLEEVYRNSAPTYTGNINISQKTDRLSYMASGGYYRQNGMLKYGNDKLDRYNFRGNATYQLTKRWSAGTNLSFIKRDYEAPPFVDGNLFWNVNRQASLSVPRNPDGTWTSAGAGVLGILQEGGRSKNAYNQTQVSFNTKVDLIKDIWSVSGDASFRFTNSGTDTYNLPVLYRTGPNQPLATFFDASVGSNSFANVGNSQPTYKVYNLYSNFQKTFAQKHSLQAIVGVNRELSTSDSYSVRRLGLISADLPEIGLATGDITTSRSKSEVALMGFFGRLNYTFDDKYIVEFNGRYDGTSRYPKGDRWGFFPSVSGAWVLSNENFLANVKESIGMNSFKIRGSYGELGNQTNDSAYPFVPTMSSGATGIIIDGKKPVLVNNPGVVAPSITWETVRKLNGGVDMEFFKNRFDLSFDVYRQNTEGMLGPSQVLPGVFGTSAPYTNAADLKTLGFELSFGWKDRFNLAGSPFDWSARVNIADNRAFITRYDNPTGVLSSYYNGMRIGEIWGLTTEGFFASDDEAANWADQSAVGTSYHNYDFFAGDLKFKDLNGDGKVDNGDNTVTNPGDRRIIGNSASRLPYSIDLNAAWKGFDLRAFFQGIGKRDYYAGGADIYFWGIYAQPWTNITEKNMDHWTPENPNAYFPRVKSYTAETGSSELSRAQTRYLQDASYLRLKNLTLGYTLPGTLLKRASINRLRVYFSAENLFTWKHLDQDLDPEFLSLGNASGGYPFQKVYSFGLNMSF